MPESVSGAVEVTPSAGRPHIPGYGIAEDSEGLLPWSWATERLTAARNYWICTTRPDGRPHAIPVWGVWLDGALYFSTGRQTRKARNISANPEIVVHLESGDEAVILEGAVREIADASLLAAADAAYAAKYIDRETGKGFHIIPEAGNDSGVYVLRPRLALGWLEREFARSPTRWRFEQA